MTRQSINEWLDRKLNDDNLIMFFKDIGQGISNIIRWFPVIWNDRQWDHFFVLYILKRKLELMSKFFKTDAWSVNSERDADKIDYCIRIIDRILKSEYDEKAYKNLYLKWGNSELNFEPIGDGEFNELLITHRNIKTKEDQAQFDKEFKICSSHADYMEKQDWSILFRMLEKHLKSWWD